MSGQNGTSLMRLFALAVANLGVSPGDFWRMTPRELAALMGAGGLFPQRSMSRARLERLMAKYPDASSDAKSERGGVGKGRGERE